MSTQHLQMYLNKCLDTKTTNKCLDTFISYFGIRKILNSFVKNFLPANAYLVSTFTGFILLQHKTY